MKTLGKLLLAVLLILASSWSLSQTDPTTTFDRVWAKQAFTIPRASDCSTLKPPQRVGSLCFDTDSDLDGDGTPGDTYVCKAISGGSSSGSCSAWVVQSGGANPDGSDGDVQIKRGTSLASVGPSLTKGYAVMANDSTPGFHIDIDNDGTIDNPADIVDDVPDFCMARVIGQGDFAWVEGLGLIGGCDTNAGGFLFNTVLFRNECTVVGDACIDNFPTKRSTISSQANALRLHAGGQGDISTGGSIVIDPFSSSDGSVKDWSGLRVFPDNFDYTSVAEFGRTNRRWTNIFSKALDLSSDNTAQVQARVSTLGGRVTWLLDFDHDGSIDQTFAITDNGVDFDADGTLDLVQDGTATWLRDPQGRIRLEDDSHGEAYIDTSISSASSIADPSVPMSDGSGAQLTLKTGRILLGATGSSSALGEYLVVDPFDYALSVYPWDNTAMTSYLGKDADGTIRRFTEAYFGLVNLDSTGSTPVYVTGLTAGSSRAVGFDLDGTAGMSASDVCLVDGGVDATCDGTADGGAGGDDITVDGTGTTNPNFSDAGDINFAYSAPNITGTVNANSVALTTDTTGNYVASVATTAPLSGGASGSEGAALTLTVSNATTGAVGVIQLAGDLSGTATSPTISADAVALGTDTTGTYVSSATTSQGLAISGTEGASVGLQDCAANQVLKRNAGDTAWECGTAGLLDTSGTPVNNQVALFVDSDTIEGTPDVTWDETTLLVAGAVETAGDGTNNGLTLTDNGTEPSAPASGKTMLYSYGGRLKKIPSGGSARVVVEAPASDNAGVMFWGNSTDGVSDKGDLVCATAGNLTCVTTFAVSAPGTPVSCSTDHGTGGSTYFYALCRRP